MRRPIKQKFVAVFAIIVLAEIFLMNIESVSSLHSFTKPLIVGSLIAYFIPNSKHLNKSTKNLTLLALIFSVIGDMFLMYTDEYPNYFIVNLKKRIAPTQITHFPNPFASIENVYKELIKYKRADGINI